MRIIIKKWICGVAASCLLFSGSMLHGCAEEEKIKLRIMHYWGETDTDVSAKCLYDILENEFEKEFPNVELVQETRDNETYKTKIKILMASNELPDIMFSWGGGFSQAFAESGRLLPVTDYLKDFYTKRMDMEMQENFIYDGTQYGICFSYWTGVLYCNQELFDQVGAEIPQTYEDLLEVSQKFREHDIDPVACGMLDKWHGQQWINNFTIQLGGAQLYKELAAGEKTLDNKVLEQAASLVQNLVRRNVFCDDMFYLTASEAEEKFLDGEAAMIYIGSWYTDAAWRRLGDKLKVAKMPQVPNAQYTKDYHGGGSNGWLVSADTEYPELATEVAAYLAWRLSCYQPQNATFLVEEKEQVNTPGEADQDIMELYCDKKEGGCAWDTLMTPQKADIWLELCAQLFDRKFSGVGFVKLLRSQIDWGELN